MEAASVGVDMSELVALMEAFRRRGKNQRDAMRYAALLLVEEVDEMFETSGHGTWDPFSENTRRARGAMSSAKLLLDTGRLAASITPAYTSNTAEAFTNVNYAKYHVSDAPRTRLPKRDFFDIDVPAVQEEFVEYLVKEIAE